MIIIPYLAIFIGFFVYIIYEYVLIFHEKNARKLNKIRSVTFIENLLKEIEDRFLKEYFTILLITLFSCSIIIYIIGWILSYIFTKKYLTLLRNAK